MVSIEEHEAERKTEEVSDETSKRRSGKRGVERIAKFPVNGVSPHEDTVVNYAETITIWEEEGKGVECDAKDEEGVRRARRERTKSTELEELQEEYD